MHDNSQTILEALANGQEVLGINAALFSGALRKAFSEGAHALALLTTIREVVGRSANQGEGVVLSTAAEPDSVLPDEVSAESGGTLESALPTEEAPSVVATAASPLQTPEPAPVALLETESPAAEPPQETVEATSATPQMPPQPALDSAQYLADDHFQDWQEPTDDPDEAGWRPSEDAMLLDEYVGLGLSLQEVADNHGRDVADVAQRLRVRHGIEVAEVQPLPAVVEPEIQRAAEPLAIEAEGVKEAAPVGLAPKAEPSLALPVAEVAPQSMPVASSVPPLQDYEAVIEQEMKRAGPESLHFATGVLKHMERAPAAVAQLQDYLQTEKARLKLSDRLRLALLAKVVARLRSAKI